MKGCLVTLCFMLAGLGWAQKAEPKLPSKLDQHYFKAADADNNGKVSGQEMRIYLDKLFQAFDKNGDGKMTFEEFRAGRRGVYSEMTKDAAGVPLSAFVRYFCGMPPPAGLPEQASTVKSTAPDCFEVRSVRFQKEDSNHDGKISPDEMAASTRQLFDFWDKERKGYLTRQEAFFNGQPRSPADVKPAAK